MLLIERDAFGLLPPGGGSWTSSDWFGSERSAPSCQIWMPQGLMLVLWRMEAGLSDRPLMMFISPVAARWKRAPTITTLSASVRGRPLYLTRSSGPRNRPAELEFRRIANSWSLS